MPNHPYDVTIGFRTTTVIAKSVGHACRLAFRARARADVARCLEGVPKSMRRARLQEAHLAREIYQTPQTAKEGGLFEGVSVNARNSVAADIGRTARFIDICNAARRRAGLPEKKERARRRR